MTAALEAFKKYMNLPRGQVVDRSTLLKEVETDVAKLLEQLGDLDDLIVQFDGTDAGRRFIEAWKRTRIIVDTVGGGQVTPPPVPLTPTTPPAPTK